MSVPANLTTTIGKDQRDNKVYLGYCHLITAETVWGCGALQTPVVRSATEIGATEDFPAKKLLGICIIFCSFYSCYFLNVVF